MYIAEFYRPGAIFLPGIVWVCLHLLLDRRLQKMLYSISWCITVSQDHRSVQDITIYRSKSVIFAVLTHQVLFEALAMGVPCDLGYKVWSQKNCSPSAACL